jgi:LmbE family N-acetylglucosaminyl deacetylase
MDVTRFQWLRRLLSSHPALNRVRVHLRAFHADVLLSLLAGMMSRPFAAKPLRTMVISPHQDDETLGCGGMIALKCLQGVAVQIVFLTDGAHAPLPSDGSVLEGELVKTRVEEARAATHALGSSDADLHFLGLPDNTLQSLTGTSREGVVERLRALIVEHEPEEIYVPHHVDGHGDHEAAYDLVVEAIHRSRREVVLLQYLIWRPWLEPIFAPSCLKDLWFALRLPIEAVAEEKAHAIAEYVSQVATLPAGFLARFHRPYELFFPSPLESRTPARAS